VHRDILLSILLLIYIQSKEINTSREIGIRLRAVHIRMIIMKRRRVVISDISLAAYG